MTNLGVTRRKMKTKTAPTMDAIWDVKLWPGPALVGGAITMTAKAVFESTDKRVHYAFCATMLSAFMNKSNIVLWCANDCMLKPTLRDQTKTGEK